ncbi:hypothetical protein BDV10DRAFT_198336 [Aspergillus recurvatus]
MRQLMQELYPDLPLHEAYRNLHPDIGPTLIAILEPYLGTSQTTAINLTTEVDDISAQPTTEILKGIKSNALGPLHTVTYGVEPAAAGAGLSGESAKSVPAGLTDNTLPAAQGASNIPPESLLYRIDYLECWRSGILITIQTAQAHQATRALNVIADHLGDRNCIAVMGAGGPDGFARPIYDLINMKISKIDRADRKSHRFFIYHDSNNWHPAFDRLTRENPLPLEFVNNPSDDLDQMLVAKDPKQGKAIMFHLLIPSWSKLQIKEPLHFHEGLYPLRTEGLKYGGKDQVELNLPAAPDGLLRGVANVLDAESWNKIARGTSTVVTGPAVGWGVNGACLAAGLGVGAFTGAGLLLAMPLWTVCAPFAMKKSAPVIEETIYNALCEEEPGVLGSNERLHRPARHS